MAMTLRLDDEQERRLELLAEHHRISKAAIVRRALDEKFEREQGQVLLKGATDFLRNPDLSGLERILERNIAALERFLGRDRD